MDIINKPRNVLKNASYLPSISLLVKEQRIKLGMSQKEFADQMGLQIALLTGSTKKSERKIIHQNLLSGELHIIVGTHALLEEVVQFKKLGLAIVDEQHRFGVAQRSRLWQKNDDIYPFKMDKNILAGYMRKVFLAVSTADRFPDSGIGSPNAISR